MASDWPRVECGNRSAQALPSSLASPAPASLGRQPIHSVNDCSQRANPSAKAARHKQAKKQDAPREPERRIRFARSDRRRKGGQRVQLQEQLRGQPFLAFERVGSKSVLEGPGNPNEQPGEQSQAQPLRNAAGGQTLLEAGTRNGGRHGLLAALRLRGFFQRRMRCA